MKDSTTAANSQDSHICPRCGAVYASDSALASHVSSHVTGVPTDPYVCLECGASFASREDWQEHAGVHGESEDAAA